MRSIFIIAILALAAGFQAEGKLRVARRQQQPTEKPETSNGLTAQKIDTAMRRMTEPFMAAPIEPLPAQCPTVSIDAPSTVLDSIVRSSEMPDAMPQPVYDPTTDFEGLAITGAPEVAVERMTAFVRLKNPDFDQAIAQAFYDVGHRYGIRGDIALCQSILETGWFRFADGTAVGMEQHNYCGLGVTQRGKKGHSFETIEQGVTAQIQHLYAYATSTPLPEGETLIDPRFKLVERGVAPTWRDLNRRWAMNDRYSQSIMNLFKQLITFQEPQCATTVNLKE